MLIEKISMPFMLVATIASAAAGAGAVWGSTHDELSRDTKEVGKLNRDREAHELRLQALELKLDAVLHSLDRIENRLGTKR